MLQYCLENCKLDDEKRKILEDEILDYKIR
jgi:hypothetical protein